MSLFGTKERQTIEALERELANRDKRIQQLKDLCEEKDEYFLSVISDGLRHGSPESARHMADRKKYLNGK